jgi:hypothetical protein
MIYLQTMEDTAHKLIDDVLHNFVQCMNDNATQNVTFDVIRRDVCDKLNLTCDDNDQQLSPVQMFQYGNTLSMFIQTLVCRNYASKLS